jgi:hypothetical protein
MRDRCLTLLLALVAWFVVPAAPRVVAADGGPAIQYAARTATSPATIERATDGSDRRARPEQGNAALPGATMDVPFAAVALAPALLALGDEPFVPRTRSSAQPRGPPVA